MMINLNNSNKLIRFIDYIYENISIYHTLIINDNNNNILNLKKILIKKDYPTCIINNIEVNDKDLLIILENKFRIFILEIDILNNYIKSRKNNLNTINIIFCLDKCIYKKVCELLKLNNNIICADNLYIFSSDNI